jgi:peptidoglycan/xylan/chitin deacetylase (PgdA/CDA1 family)
MRPAGHYVGNHSWDHPVFTRIGSSERARQVLRAARAFGPAATRWPRLFRPPGGVQSLRTRMEAAALGYRTVTWSAAVDDWMTMDGSALEARIDAALRPGAIVLLHDALYRVHDAASEPDRSMMIEALDRVMSARRELRYVTVPELTAAGRPNFVDWRLGDDWLPAGRRADGEVIGTVDRTRAGFVADQPPPRRV